MDGILDILGKRMYHCSPRTSRSHGIRNSEFGIWNSREPCGATTEDTKDDGDIPRHAS